MKICHFKNSEAKDPNAKKCKSAESEGTKDDSIKPKVERNGNASTADNGNGVQKQGKNNTKPPEPPKDYIHVRARRGQATDSHSLAERVKFLNLLFN